MRIAIVTAKFPEISETFVINHITAMVDLGHDVSIFAFHRSKLRQGWGDHGLVQKYDLEKKTAFIATPKQRLKRLYHAIRISMKLAIRNPRALRICMDRRRYGWYDGINNLIKLDAFSRKKLDVIHSHFGHIGREVIFLKRIYPWIKFVTTFHGYDVRFPLERGEDYYHELFALSDGIISISSYNRCLLLKFGCPESKIIDLPNGIDTARFSPVSVAEGDPYVIVTVARMVDEKNLQYALQIVEALSKKGCNFEYRLIGEGYLRKELEDFVCDHQLNSCVKFLGALSQSEIIPHLNQSHVFLLTSKLEAMGVVLLEAQAMELPVVCTKVGGMVDVIEDEKSGKFIPQNEPEVAAQIIYDLLRDEKKRHLFGKTGRANVKRKFDNKQQYKNLVSYYRQ